MSTAVFNPWRNRTNVFGSAFPIEFHQVFDRLWNDSDVEKNAACQWSPRVDIKEEENRYLILADVPGVEPSEIEIQMDKGELTIKGERSVIKNEEANGYSRIERMQGKFMRRFALPDTVDADGITATGKNGVLEISIPKKPDSAPRKIVVQ
jgi:HSP20 family protein